MENLFIKQIRKRSRPLEPIPCDLQPVLQKMKGIKAVIFDVYGTCFISGSGDIGITAADPKVEALLLSLKEQGITVSEARAEEGMALFFKFIEQDHQKSRLQGIDFPEVRILEIWEQWRREMQVEVDVGQLAIDVECRLNPVWPMPGLQTCLEKLRSAGAQLGIVSNAQIFTPFLFPALTGCTLEEFGFMPEKCVWSWTDREAKPSIRLYEKVLEGFSGVSAEECLYVGNDMRNDVAPASAVGMKTALFAGDKRSLRLREGDPIVDGVDPDLVIPHLSRISECI